MKKYILSVVIVLFALTVIFSLRFLLGGSEDNWVCRNGEWVKRGNPGAPMPESGCGGGKEEIIKVSLPEPNRRVNSPIQIKGEARGPWFFEADFPIRLETLGGEEIAAGYASAREDWMSEDFVEFSAELEYFTDSNLLANLVFEKANPSGLPEHDDKITIPVVLEANPAPKKDNVKIYFLNSELDPEMTCTNVFGVERPATSTLAVGRAAIQALLAGPTDEENGEGYSSAIPGGVKLNSLSVEDGKAYADFSEELDKNVAGSCAVSAIRAQIEETLKQFSGVDEVVISVNNESEAILQP